MLQVHMDLLRQSEEELKEARQEVLRRSSEVNVQREEVKRLQDMLQKEEKKLRSAIRDNQSLSTCIRQLSQELEELRGKHQVTGSNHSVNSPVTYILFCSSIFLSKNSYTCTYRLCLFIHNINTILTLTCFWLMTSTTSFCTWTCK